MNDIRVRIINLIIISISFSTMPDDKLWIVFVLTLLYCVLLRKAFINNLKLIVFVSFVISAFSISVYFITTGISFSEVILNLGRFISLVIISVLFFYQINLLSFVAALRFFKIPSPLAIAFGVGFRFIPIISDEIQKIIFIQNQNNLGFSFKSIQKYGLFEVVNRFFSPLLLSVLRKSEAISVSIVVQEIQNRVKNYIFKKPTIAEFFLIVISIVVLSISTSISSQLAYLVNLAIQR